MQCIQNMKKFFGTDGIRTAAGRHPLQPAALEALGAALVAELAAQHDATPRIVFGGDTRESTPWIAAALMQGVKNAGGEIASAGVIPTPGVAYLTQTGGYHAGVVISASHNPYHDNGVKIFQPSGAKQSDDMEARLEAALEGRQPEAEMVTPDESPEIWEDPTLGVSYLEFLTSRIGRGLNLSKMKVAIDCAHGAAALYAPIVLQSLGAEVYVTAARPDGKNINRECGALYPEIVSQFVRDTGADIGLAFDGDADRCLFVDRTGQLVDGDATLFLLAKHFDEKNKLAPRCVVATVMSNLGLELALRKRDIALHRTPVGDRYVLEELLKVGGALGGEQSGHIILPQQSLAGDGMITALNVIRVLVESETSLRDAVADFVKCPQILVNIRVREKIPFEKLPGVAAVAREVERHFDGSGRLLLRYSGTENLARVMIEGENERDVTTQAYRLADAIKAEIGA